MKNIVTLLCIALLSFTSCKKENNKSIELTAKKEVKTRVKSDLKIIPIEHATMVLEYENNVIYVDPVGGVEAFKGQKKPTLILITDIHGDHLNAETLEALDLSHATLVMPKAVAEKLPELKTLKNIILDNGKTTTVNTIAIEAIPMYNLREEALKFHAKGRGNGYLLTLGNERIYISGDTEDIPEMRALKNIDKAFVCMNLPYTMPVESAASAVLDFKPKQVYPYHFRGTEGLSDVALFKTIVSKQNKDIEVIQLQWY
ncbi:MBL fold metallo-hydrolase [Lacinutrix sp. C3R15]|uniref:MBL fold metallo-hydrolase n=1 Tax=Flavobacteriaceae TaxID=49546 RepID=UPI001C09D46D|nr:MULTISPECIES: MBL fold metallo-hydrolase [Flavobacteriaceae]MBU2938740.1 MBL fold metallo-hydrolase [Lacinutrix sp. C3R15]MDO6622053.1 MBL fold metallo-hydrolase [Oceanihabitans sp. 1_MG-2023]